MGAFAKDPEAARAARLEREEKAAREATQQRANNRDNTIVVLNFSGGVLLMLGLWLLLHPAGGVVEGVQIANLNTMLLGQTLATVGGIFFAAAAVIRTR